MPRDGCGPATEVGTAPAKLPQIPDDLQPRLRSHVLGVFANEPPQIPEKSGLNAPIDDPEVRLVPTPGTPQSPRQLLIAGRRAAMFPTLPHALLLTPLTLFTVPMPPRMLSAQAAIYAARRERPGRVR